MMTEAELLKIVRAQEDQIRPQRFESAFFWDWKGNLLLAKDGEPTTVKFSDLEMALVQGAVSTHNHPFGWRFSVHDPRRAGYSFSKEDLKSACQVSLALLRIVTPKFRFMMKPPSQGWDTHYWEQVLQPEYDRIYKDVQAELKANVQARRIMQSEAETLFRDLVWTHVSAQLGLVYSREEF
jgi:hypothetical protein